jgi:hypothetical protein
LAQLVQQTPALHPCMSPRRAQFGTVVAGTYCSVRADIEVITA